MSDDPDFQHGVMKPEGGISWHAWHKLPVLQRQDLRDHRKPCKIGQRGEVVVTNFFNAAQPSFDMPKVMKLCWARNAHVDFVYLLMKKLWSEQRILIDCPETRKSRFAFPQNS
ncbi:MAG: hypothetical protein KGO94_08120 [Alphaproteobacteria bacterium]|nr:hypothetical protein [Alphaproteobacteria bacterium]